MGWRLYKVWVFYPRSEKSSHEPSAQFNPCFFILNINQFFAPSNLQSHLQNKRTFNRASPHNSFFEQQHEYCANSKIPLVISRKQLCTSNEPLLSSFQTGLVLINKTKKGWVCNLIISEGCSQCNVIWRKASHGWSRANEIPWSNNEHSMRYDYCHISHIHNRVKWEISNWWQGWTKSEMVALHYTTTSVPLKQGFPNFLWPCTPSAF